MVERATGPDVGLLAGVGGGAGLGPIRPSAGSAGRFAADRAAAGHRAQPIRAVRGAGPAPKPSGGNRIDVHRAVSAAGPESHGGFPRTHPAGDPDGAGLAQSVAGDYFGDDSAGAGRRRASHH